MGRRVIYCDFPSLVSKNITKIAQSKGCDMCIYIISISRRNSQLKLKYFFFCKFGGGLMLSIKIIILFIK